VKSTSIAEPRPSLALALATAGGAGLLRPAPGTWGSVVAMALAYGLLLVVPPDLIRWSLLGLVGLTLIAAWWSVPRCVRWFGRGDPGQIVIDEVAGVWIGLAILPPGILATPLTSVLAVGILFRVFDIAKPGLIGSLESLHGTVGIMADDLGAGLMAGALTTAIWH
jgi:phosphatidylglycerophosphatase A